MEQQLRDPVQRANRELYKDFKRLIEDENITDETFIKFFEEKYNIT